jgi:nucleotide-binding universal stress UspA family protein
VKKKQKTKKILVPLDDSQNSIRGLKHAITLAKQTGRSIIGLHVMPVYLMTAIPRGFEVKSEMAKEGKTIMNRARQLTLKNNIQFEEKLVDGIPGINIVNFAHSKKNKIDLIVIGSSSKGILKEKYFGSVANYVLNKSMIPVLVT